MLGRSEVGLELPSCLDGENADRMQPRSLTCDRERTLSDSDFQGDRTAAVSTTTGPGSPSIRKQHSPQQVFARIPNVDERLVSCFKCTRPPNNIMQHVICLMLTEMPQAKPDST